MKTERDSSLEKHEISTKYIHNNAQRDVYDFAEGLIYSPHLKIMLHDILKVRHKNGLLQFGQVQIDKLVSTGNS